MHDNEVYRLCFSEHLNVVYTRLCASHSWHGSDSSPLNITDEKEKFEPTVFRDTIIQGLNEAGGDLDAVAKFLDVTGSRLDYRRYADTLFDILIAGSMLGMS